MLLGKKVIVYMPGWNVAKTLERTIKAIPPGFVDQMILVDNASTDGTPELAKRLGLEVIRHETNRGYGGSQKTGYREALARNADIIVMLHSDFQYDPTLLREMAMPVAEGRADVCFGSRMAVKKTAWRGGMHWWRFIANIGLTIVEEAVLRLRLSEYHSGYRAYSRELLLAVPFEKNSNDYVFDTEMLVQIKLGGFRATEIKIPTRYFAEAQSPNFRQSLTYGSMTLLQLAKYLLQRTGVKKFPQFNVKKRAVPAAVK